MDAQSKRASVEKACLIQMGNTYQTVTNKLGIPTHDQWLARKEDGRVIGRSLKYYAVKWQTGLVNERHDELVHIFFNEYDEVKSVRIKVNLEK